MEEKAKIYVAGHKGLVGSAIKRELERRGYKNLIFKDSGELDLRRQRETEEFFLKEKPEYVFVAAAKVGGIKANMSYPADFIYDNLQIQSNIIHSAYKSGVKKLLFIASNCMYPKDCPQPMKEEFLLTGPLEPTNEGFAIAKIAGTRMCRYYNEQYKTNFIVVVPSSMFGPNDNFDPVNSHFIPSLIRKFHEAKLKNEKKVELWGTGNARREMMYADDFADACIFLMDNYNSSEIINIGPGKDLSIKELAEIARKIIGYEGEIIFDKSKPDGMIRKLLDVSRMISIDWKPKTSIEEGIKKTYEWFLVKD